MTASVAASECLTRELLAVCFSRLLDHYNQTLALLLDEMPVDEAAIQVRSALKACVEARDRLAAHEREHGCIPIPQVVSVK
jgi:hypothetical protein